MSKFDNEKLNNTIDLEGNRPFEGDEKILDSTILFELSQEDKQEAKEKISEEIDLEINNQEDASFVISDFSEFEQESKDDFCCFNHGNCDCSDEKEDPQMPKVKLEDLVDDATKSIGFEFKDLDKIPDLDLEGFTEIELSVKFKKPENKDENDEVNKEEFESEEFSCCLSDDNQECQCKGDSTFVEDISSVDSFDQEVSKLENLSLLDDLDLVNDINEPTLDSPLSSIDTFEIIDEAASKDLFDSSIFEDKENIDYAISSNNISLDVDFEEIESSDNLFTTVDIVCDPEINEPVFNDESYLANLPEVSEQLDINLDEINGHEFVSMEGITLKSEEYKENLLNNKKDLLVDSDHQVVFDQTESNVDEDFIKSLVNNHDEEVQVIFDETSSSDISSIPTCEDKKDFFDFDLVDASQDISSNDIAITLEDLNKENDLEIVEEDTCVAAKVDQEEIVSIEVPSFETFDLNEIKEESQSNDQELLEMMNLNAEDDLSCNIDLSELNSTAIPSINVDDEINTMQDVSDIEVVDPSLNEFNSSQLSIDDLEIEYVPENDEQEFTLLDDVVQQSCEMFVNNEVESLPVFGLDDHQYTESVESDEFANIPVVYTTDAVEGIDYSNYKLESYIQPEVEFEDQTIAEFAQVPIINTTDAVEGIDYSNYQLEAYIQPELLEDDQTVIEFADDFVDDKILNNYSDSTCSHPHSCICSQPSKVEVDKEYVARKQSYPSVEEQLKKVRTPNLFRKYTVASAANMVILKSIDRLLNMTNSVIEKNGIRRK